jgi:hypothetical protein
MKLLIAAIQTARPSEATAEIVALARKDAVLCRKKQLTGCQLAAEIVEHLLSQGTPDNMRQE